MKKICVHLISICVHLKSFNLCSSNIYLCSSRKEKGFALITVMFMLVTLISAVFLAAYPLVSEPRDDIRQFITDMKDRRYKRAFHGRLADQRGGKFMSCGGFVSDYGLSKGGPYGRFEHLLYNKRLYLGSNPYQYSTEYDYWGGYRGKRFLYPVPSDVWDEDNLACYTTVMGGCSGKGWFDGFGNRFRSESWCYGKWFHVSSKKNFTIFCHRQHVYIIVKDYTKTSEDIDLEIILASGGSQQVEYPSRHKIKLGQNYNLHTFYFYWVKQGIQSPYIRYTGLKKVVIKIGGVVKFTKALVIPVWCGCWGPHRSYVGDIFSEEIEYYG